MADNNDAELSSGSAESSDRSQSSSGSSASGGPNRDRPKPAGLGARLRALFSRKDDPSKSASRNDPGDRERGSAQNSQDKTKSQKPLGARVMNKIAPKTSLRGKIIYGAAGAMVAGLSIFGFMSSPRPPLQVANTTCSTKGCHYMGKVLAVGNYPEADAICDDFFSAVCSKKISGDKKIDEIQETLYKAKFDWFALPHTRPWNWRSKHGEFSDSEAQMGRLFRSCLERNEGTGDAHRFFRYLVSDLGIPVDYGVEKQTLSIFAALVRLSLVWGVNHPLFSVELVPLRGRKHYVAVVEMIKKDLLGDLDESNATESRWGLHQRIVNFVSRSAVILRRGWQKKRYDKTRQIINAVFAGNDSLNERYVDQMVINYEAVVDFINNASNVKQDDMSLTKGDFENAESFSEFPWRVAITRGVKLDVKIPDKAQVIMDRPKTAAIFARTLLDERLHRIWRFYLHVWILREFATWIGGKAEELYCLDEFGEDECKYLKEGNLWASQCFKTAREYFPRTYSALVSRYMVKNRTMAEVNLTVSMLILNSARAVKDTTFMESVDKVRSMRAFATLIRYVGAPDYLHHKLGVEYSVEVGRNYFQDMMLITRARAEEKLLSFERSYRLSRKRWPYMALGETPAIAYDDDSNSITIPATYMQFPYHVPGTPLWLTLAGLGWTIVHELFHAFNSVNRNSQMAEWRRHGAWHDATKRQLEARLGCYTKYYNEISDLYPNESRAWLDSAGIDSTATSVVLYSFGFLERQFGWVILESAGYDHPGIYWVAMAKPLCFATYLEDPDWNFRFSKWRVNHALRERKPFPKGFKCADNQDTAQKTCEPWLGP